MPRSAPRQGTDLGYRGAAMVELGAEERAAFAQGFDRLYGLEMLAYGDEEVRAQVTVRDDLKQPMGLVHGGVYAAIAESIASFATFAAVAEDGNVATGLGNATSFLRPVTGGTIHAHARRMHRGRTTWVWDVSFTDDAQRLCALTRMTIAVRPAR